MNLIDKAIKRITEECEGKDYLIPFEEYLTSICNESTAPQILSTKKTLEGCYENMKSIAKKRAVKGCAYIPPEEGYQIIREYYDITIEEKTHEANEVIDITDLF